MEPQIGARLANRREDFRDFLGRGGLLGFRILHYFHADEQARPADVAHLRVFLLEIQQAARDFAQNSIAPIAAEFDESGEFPIETVRQMGQLGQITLNRVHQAD